MLRNILTTFALLLLALPAQALTIVDSFTEDVPFLTTGTNLDAGGFLLSRRAGVIGGSIAGGLNANAELTVMDLIGGVAAEVFWPDIGGAQDTDLTAGGDDHFEVDFSNVQGDWTATLTVDDGVTGASVAVAGLTAGTASFAFSDFGGVDLTSADLVRLLLTNSAGIGDTVSAAEIRTGAVVPEPATAAMFGIGLVGLGLASRRRWSELGLGVLGRRRCW